MVDLIMHTISQELAVKNYLATTFGDMVLQSLQLRLILKYRTIDRPESRLRKI